MAGVAHGMKRGIATGAIALAALVTAPVDAVASSSPAWNLFYEAHMSGFFTSVAVISKTDAWAAGTLFNGHAILLRPFLRQWNGSSWNAVTIPGASNFESQWVAASSAANVWVMGASNGRIMTRVYRFDGSRWHAVPVPVQTWLADPVVFGPDDVWARGSNGSSSDIFHWNGSRWARFTVGKNLVDLSGTRQKDVWAVGLDSQRSFTGKIVAYRWNGSRWLTVSMPHPASTALEDIRVSSISNVWISGTQVRNNDPPFVLHWNGQAWSKVAAPRSLPASSTDLLPDGSGGAWLGPEAHWTGQVWKGPVPILPEPATWSDGSMGRVPGTASYWSTAGTTTKGSALEEPSIYLYGPVP